MTNYKLIKKLASYGLVLSLTSIAVGQAQRSLAITLQFDYTYDEIENGGSGFFNQTRKNTLEEAASYFEPITDDLAAITDNDSDLTDIGATGYYYDTGSTDGEGNPVYEEIINTWTATFTNPSDGSITESIPDLTVAADTLKIYVGARELSSLGEAGPGAFSASGLTDFVNLVSARGESGALETTPTDFGRWGGSISFDKNLDSGWSWNDDFNDPLEKYEHDLLSVAIHEIGHVLGFGTAPSWNTYVSGTEFIGSKSVQTYGGNVPLTSYGGHWAEGTISYVNGMSQEAAMDPDLNSLNGQSVRKEFTALDYAGLGDVGWETEALVAANIPFEFSPGMGIFLVAGLFGAKKGLQELKKRKN